MGIASLIIGIIAVVLGLIPGCGLIVGLPLAIVGLILGIVEISAKSKKQEPKGMGKAGTILCAVAIVISIVWNVFIAVRLKDSAGDIEAAMGEFSTEMQKASAEMQKVAELAAEKAAAEMQETATQEAEETEAAK